MIGIASFDCFSPSVCAATDTARTVAAIGRSLAESDGGALWWQSSLDLLLGLEISEVPMDAAWSGQA